MFDWLDFNDQTEIEAGFEKPKRLSYAVKNRVFLADYAKQSLNDLIPELPDKDHDLLIFTNGSGATFKTSQHEAHAYEIGHFIPFLVDKLKTPCEAYISTWTMNRAHAENLLEMLNNGLLWRLWIFTDQYFVRRESANANLLKLGLSEHKEGRFLAFKNHAKLIALRNKQGDCVSIMTSANLSAQPRVEQLNLTTNPDVYQFIVEHFFRAILDKVHEREKT